MGSYGGPSQWDTPDFGDSVPPDPANQGSPGDSGHVTQQPMTSNPPRVRMSMASPTHVNLAQRSMTPPGIGGSFMPGNKVQSATSGGSEERSSAAY
jgi:hypothetical protein